MTLLTLLGPKYNPAPPQLPRQPTRMAPTRPEDDDEVLVVWHQYHRGLQ